MTWLAAIAGLSILTLAAIVLALIGAGRATMRDISRQLRVVSPPKQEQPQPDETAPAAGGAQ